MSAIVWLWLNVATKRDPSAKRIWTFVVGKVESTGIASRARASQAPLFSSGVNVVGAAGSPGTGLIKIIKKVSNFFLRTFQEHCLCRKTPSILVWLNWILRGCDPPYWAGFHCLVLVATTRRVFLYTYIISINKDGFNKTHPRPTVLKNWTFSGSVYFRKGPSSMENPCRHNLSLMIISWRGRLLLLWPADTTEKQAADWTRELIYTDLDCRLKFGQVCSPHRWTSVYPVCSIRLQIDSILERRV